MRSRVRSQGLLAQQTRFHGHNPLRLRRAGASCAVRSAAIIAQPGWVPHPAAARRRRHGLRLPRLSRGRGSPGRHQGAGRPPRQQSALHRSLLSRGQERQLCCDHPNIVQRAHRRPGQRHRQTFPRPGIRGRPQRPRSARQVRPAARSATPSTSRWTSPAPWNTLTRATSSTATSSRTTSW